MVKEVQVLPYDERWPIEYQQEVARISKILEPEIVAVHHIGSTAIPGIYAKPIIDIMLEVREISKIDEFNKEMVELGYEPRGELGIPGRRYFSRHDSTGVSTHHIHMYQLGDPNIERHIAFKEYMIAHPEDAKEYAKLKRKLARKYPSDIESYCAGKEKFVDEMEAKAIMWKKNSSG